jgi:glycosyltransferase involved in cell wall biosynthesis
MTHLFLNGLAASAGGGLTYLRNVIPHLSAKRDVSATVLLSPGLRQEFGGPPGVIFLEANVEANPGRRFWQEQTMLRRLVRQSGANVVISTGNFALRKSPVPQILLSRNALYTSADFFNDLRSRKDYRIWADTKIKSFLARQSIRWADCTVAPSEAFARELRQWARKEIVSIPHGFDHEAFFIAQQRLPPDVQKKVEAAQGSLRLLFVSHYNYYRNFETLFHGVALLQQLVPDRHITLFLTCQLRSEDNPGAYDAGRASALVHRLGISNNIVELGTVPYHLLHHLYRASDIYATAAYAESFAHPLVEAMASGLPIVASDLYVHREICGDAALYFPRFSAERMAERVLQVSQSMTLQRQLADSGLKRSRDFSWSSHVAQLIHLAEDLLKRSNGRRAEANLELVS